MDLTNFELAPDHLFRFINQPYVSRKPGSIHEQLKQWMTKILSDDQGRITAEFLNMQKTIHGHGNTFTAWKANPNMNRYNDMICYDQTRVTLTDGLQPDFIHANFVNGYNRKNAYILTQGPMQSTVIDFWRMVWQEKVATIVMVTLLEEVGKPKCARYFPLNNEVEFQAGIFKISSKKVDKRVSCMATLLSITNMLNQEIRYCAHICYTVWPDKGVPEDEQKLKMFMNYVKLINYNVSKKWYDYPDKHPRGQPIIYHCSAGVGRSAVLVILDVLTEALVHNEFLDCLLTVQRVRKERFHAIHTKIQLLYVYDFFISMIDKLKLI